MAEYFTITKEIRDKAKKDTRLGTVIAMTPKELIDLMELANEALGSESGDEEHDALYEINETLSEVFEDPSRRVH